MCGCECLCGSLFFLSFCCLHFGPRLDLFVCRSHSDHAFIVKLSFQCPSLGRREDLAPKARSNPFKLLARRTPPSSIVQRPTNSSAIYCIASVIICNLLSHTLVPPLWIGYRSLPAFMMASEIGLEVVA